MITQTMTPLEIVNEVHADFKNIEDKSMSRLVKIYNRERIIRKVPKNSRYVKDYQLKTAKKNPWIIFISKPHKLKKYKGAPQYFGITYHYGKQGIRVFEVNYDGVNVYNGHLFSRYNQRLGLNIALPVERIKRFFLNRGYCVAFKQNADQHGRVYYFLPVSEGVLLGEEQENGLWVVYKTFLSNDLLRHSQRNLIHEIEDFVKNEAKFEQEDPNASREEYEWMSNVFNNTERSSIIPDLLNHSKKLNYSQ